MEGEASDEEQEVDAKEDEDADGKSADDDEEENVSVACIVGPDGPPLNSKVSRKIFNFFFKNSKIHYFYGLVH